MRRSLTGFVALTLAALIGQSAAAKTFTVSPGAAAQERLQAALIDAKPGDVVRLASGRFELSDGLSLDVADVVVQGAGPGKQSSRSTNRRGRPKAC